MKMKKEMVYLSIPIWFLVLPDVPFQLKIIGSLAIPITLHRVAISITDHLFRLKQKKVKEIFGDDLIMVKPNIFKTKIPINEVSKAKLELALDTNIIGDLKSYKNHKNQFEIKTDKNKILKCYGKDIPEQVKLLNALDEINSKPHFISAHQTELVNVYNIRSKINPNKMRRQVGHIAHLIGAKKGSLTIGWESGIFEFTIHTENRKQYNLDDLISKLVRPNMKLPFISGIDRVTGKPTILDFAKIQHSMFSGMTGSGKSSILHAIIQSLMYWNDNIFFFMVDLKGSELKKYKNFSNCKVVTICDGRSLDETMDLIMELGKEVESEYYKRINLFDRENVVDLDEYNRKNPENPLPYVFFLFEEANGIKEVIEKHDKMYNKRLRAENQGLAADDKNYEYLMHYDKIVEILDNLFSRGRSVGIWNLHTMQQVTDATYPIAWRRSMMTKFCAKMPEKMQCQKILESRPELQDEAFKQGIGEYILLDVNNKAYKMQNARYRKDFKHETFKELERKFVTKIEKKEESGDNSASGKSADIPQTNNG